MNILFWVIILCLFLPHSAFAADMALSFAASNVQPRSSLSEKQDLPDEVMIRHFEGICNAVSEAGRLEELKPLILDKDFAFLKARIEAGVSQYVILAILQGMRPQAIRIVDSRVEEGRAELVVFGRSALGPTWGQINLVQEEGVWKIAQEAWHAGKYSEQRDELIATVFKSISDVEQYISPSPKQATSNDGVRKRLLSSARVKDHRRKRALMFVFPMNNDRTAYGRPAAARKDMLARIHGLRSIKLSPEQVLPEGSEMVELFVKKGDARYDPGEWNVVIPSKTPHEVTVSWLWSF